MFRRTSWTLAAIAAVALIGSTGACSRQQPSCNDLVAAQAWKQAAAVCLDAYQRDKDPASGVAAARSMLRNEQPEEAEHLAQALKTSSRAADAFLVLGETAARRRDPEAGISAFGEALRIHQREHNDGGASRAAHGLAGVWLSRGNFFKAMEASQLAMECAARGGDLLMQLYATLGHADLLRRQGLLVAAEDDLAHASKLARTPRDQAWVALEHGSLYIELDLDSLARRHLELALATAQTGQVGSEVVGAAHINLAWLDRRAGNFARAMQHLDTAAAIDPDDVDVHVNRALVFADQGQFGDADRELDLAAKAPGSAERSWWIAYNQGLVAGRRGDVGGQIAAYQHSIDAVRAMSAHAGSYTPDVAASHRQPFLRMLGVHAKRAEWESALGLVMELDALALLSTERQPAKFPMGLASTEPNEQPTKPDLPAVKTVLDSWRGRRLAILISDEVTMWRLEVRDGGVTGQTVGMEAELVKQARDLEADPANAAAADSLGAAIVPRDVGRGVLDVLLIGAVARTPLAALVLDGRPIVGRTPMTRVLGVLPRLHQPMRSGESVVLGDPRQDLPSARAEALAVAARLDVTPILGGAATSSALAGARHADLLHVAAHSAIEDRGPSLLLADRSVSRDDIVASDGAPGVVVLASCGGAVARDDAGWGSLAAAYIAAGADAVLASSWTIEDAGTRRFVEELYRHPVHDQPARALAAAQSSSRGVLPVRVWAGFTVIAAPPQLSL